MVTDSRNCRDGRFIERLGFFNPIAVGGETELSLDRERVAYWVGCGAQPSDSVAQLIKRPVTPKADATVEVVAAA